jgi:glycosyltransferase involved in cell wall biosynthesis
MRVLIDAVPITGASTAIVTEHLLNAWADLKTDDEIHVVIGPAAEFEISPKLHVHRVRHGRLPLFHRLWAQSVTIPRLCRKLDTDIVLGLIASTTITPLHCPRSILVHDMRHEIRPEQFSGRALLAKRVSYWLGYRQARAIACISERTKYDLLDKHPELKRTMVRVVHHGADHTATWPPRKPGEDYAIAFGQYCNKNVQLLLRGWAQLHARKEAIRLFIFGLPDADRKAAEATATELGIADLVHPLPWLPHAEYQEYFTSASVVVFPSDFEGFGLPAVEAMSLGIPLVISPDAALLEVTGGHAVTLPGESPAALAQAVIDARQLTDRALQDARVHAKQFTWANSAAGMRTMLADAIGKPPSPAKPRPRSSEKNGEGVSASERR